MQPLNQAGHRLWHKKQRTKWFWVLITARATLLVTVSYPVMCTGWQGNAIIQYTNIQVVRLWHLSGGKKAHFALKIHCL